MNMNTKKIVGVVGMCGSGKSELTNLFVNDGFERIYFGQVTLNELEKNHLEKNEINEKYIREEIRSKHGKDAYAKLMIPYIDQACVTNNVVLDGLYSWGEYLLLKKYYKQNLIILAIITNGYIRKSRLEKRKIRPLLNEEVNNRDFSEIENLDKVGPIAIADYYILNNDGFGNLDQQYRSFIYWLNGGGNGCVKK